MNDRISTTQQHVDREKFSANFDKIPKHEKKAREDRCWCGAEWIGGFCGEILRQHRDRT